MDAQNYGEGPKRGTTSIAPGVLVTIARLTALSVPGVTGLARVPGGVNRLFRRGTSEGVQIEVQDDHVEADLYLILAADVNVREVSRNVQAEVASAIEHMVGMQVGRIDIHIEDIDFSQTGG